ncbi:hypothetical protein E1B28_007017 [Marasmius oreades]|uniref:Uncharacterized protein n=1 Tax=Marasmius oreades TaxID=181124 RepID=A0A9P7S1E4_9AGAR|nr:uncharacterized protein E1B28_007017 [Marasmius oreades]KAG7093337.1 hypothetical protein E1B28_007017 [Marasmius oreades]
MMCRQGSRHWDLGSHLDRPPRPAHLPNSLRALYNHPHLRLRHRYHRNARLRNQYAKGGKGERNQGAVWERRKATRNAYNLETAGRIEKLVACDAVVVASGFEVVLCGVVKCILIKESFMANVTLRMTFCGLDVLTTFSVVVEILVTRRAIGDGFVVNLV